MNIDIITLQTPTNPPKISISARMVRRTKTSWPMMLSHLVKMQPNPMSSS